MFCKFPETKISLEENIKEVFIKKQWFIFTWHELVKTETFGKDLVIETTENYDNIILNGKKLN